MRSIQRSQPFAGWLSELYAIDPGARDGMRRVLTLLAGRERVGSRFDDHALTGQLSGWRACEIGDGGRLVYYVEAGTVWLVSVGPHDEAYTRAQALKIERAGRVSRRRQKQRRR